MNKNNIIIIFIVLISLSGCYTYNIPSGANTPLISEKGESKLTVGANFNELGGNYSIALTDHIVFTASGSAVLVENKYKQDYDSVFLKKTPNKFEVGFGYYGGKNKFRNLFLFGAGTGHGIYDEPRDNYYYESYQNTHEYGSIQGYYQIDYVHYFLQYTAGFKFQKNKFHSIKYKEHGVSLRYAYNDYHVTGIATANSSFETYNEETGTYEYIETEKSSIVEEVDYFNAFSAYYFFRTGNEKVQFEISPGFSIYEREPEYRISLGFVRSLHFNVGMVFNLNQFKK